MSRKQYSLLDPKAPANRLQTNRWHYQAGRARHFASGTMKRRCRTAMDERGEHPSELSVETGSLLDLASISQRNNFDLFVRGTGNPPFAGAFRVFRLISMRRRRLAD